MRPIQFCTQCVQNLVKVLGPKLAASPIACLSANPLGLAVNAGWYLGKYGVSLLAGPTCRPGEIRIPTSFAL